MRLDEAQVLARGLMDAHGLREWAFGFNRRKRALGLCYYQRKRIELSTHYVTGNDVASIRDTVLHEVAHALAGQRAGHGPRWKALCRTLGATPARCDTTAAMPRGRWRAVCPSCRSEFSRHRRPVRNARYSCRRCGPERGPVVFVVSC